MSHSNSKGMAAASGLLRALVTVPTANPIWGSRRPAHNTCCKSDVRAIFSGNNREAQEVHAENCETKVCAYRKCRTE
jgi:hypothetical protein